MKPAHSFQHPVQLLAPQHDRVTFACGVEALDRYLLRQASQDMKRKIAITYVQPENDGISIAGYYALAATSIKAPDLPSEISQKLPKYPQIPATLLGRLAVNQKWSGQGVGRRLVMDALDRSYEQSQRIGSAAVIVDAKNEEAAAFYAQYGFKPFPNDSFKLLMPMNTIAQLHQRD